MLGRGSVHFPGALARRFRPYVRSEPSNGAVRSTDNVDLLRMNSSTSLTLVFCFVFFSNGMNSPESYSVHRSFEVTFLAASGTTFLPLRMSNPVLSNWRKCSSVNSELMSHSAPQLRGFQIKAAAASKNETCFCCCLQIGEETGSTSTTSSMMFGDRNSLVRVSDDCEENFEERKIKTRKMMKEMKRKKNTTFLFDTTIYKNVKKQKSLFDVFLLMKKFFSFLVNCRKFSFKKKNNQFQINFGCKKENSNN